MLEPLLPEEFRKKAVGNLRASGFKKSTLKKNSAEESHSFSSILETEAGKVFDGEADQFLEDLETLEKNLLQNPNAHTISRYRKGVGDFLRKMTANYGHMDFYRVKNGQKKVYRIWQVLDRELDQVCREVIADQLKAFMLLDKLQEVKGLIIDLKVGKEEKQ